MYYPDLTPYDYGTTEYEDALNIGWLEKGHEFPTGDFPEKFWVVKKLESMEIKNKYRGWHGCEFCYPDDEYTPNRFNPEVIRNPNFVPPQREYHNGNGEYIVQGNGKTYAAPTLIIHYITAHNYIPPQEFIDAVINN